MISAKLMLHEHIHHHAKHLKSNVDSESFDTPHDDVAAATDYPRPAYPAEAKFPSSGSTQRASNETSYARLPAAPKVVALARAKQEVVEENGEEEEDDDDDEEEDDDLLPESVTGQISVKLKGSDEEIWGTASTLGEDAWAAAIVSAARIYAVTRLKMEAKLPARLDLVHLGVSAGVMMLNLALQFGVLWYIWQFVVEPAVHDVQIRYRHFRAHVLDENGKLHPDVWHDYEYKGEICQIAMVNTVFYYSIMLIWVLTNMTEWRNIERLWRNVSKIQTCTRVQDMLIFTETQSFAKGGPCLIVAVTPTIRVVVISLVIVPRMLISVFLSWLGLRMLTSSQSFSDMVLNTLALGFVVSIDELLCQSVLPLATRKLLEDTNLFIKDGDDPKTLEQVENGEWMGFKRTMLWLLGSTFYLVLYSEVLQAVLPVEVRQLSNFCKTYLTRMQTPVCDQAAFHGGGSCFPAGAGAVFDADEF